MTKVVTIEATFPELKIKNMYQQGRGRGSSVRVAFAAAGRNLFKQPGLKRKQFSFFTAKFSVGTMQDEGKETNDQASVAEQDQGQSLPR